jgi:serine/threonine-protein kinase
VSVVTARSRRSSWWLAAVLVGATAVAILAWRLGATPRPADPALPRAAPAAPASTAVTDLPVPPSSNGDATLAYRQGMQAFRDGAMSVAIEDLERAVASDPGMAGAWVQLLAAARLGGVDVTARDAFDRARKLRAELGERDQRFLDAIEPLIDRQPVDFAEAETRFRLLSQRYPGDIEVLSFLALCVADQGRLRENLAIDEIIAGLDPSSASAYGSLAYAHEYLGEWQEARAAAERGLAIAFAAPSCVRSLAFLDEVEGKCGDLEALARQSVTAWPKEPGSYELLAEGVLASGKSVEAALQALALKWAAMPEQTRPRAEATDRLRLALFQGDFRAAEQSATRLEGLLAGEPQLEAHGETARALVAIFSEEGRTADAGRVAVAFLAKRDVWVQGQIFTNFAVLRDATPDMLEARYRADGARDRFEEDRSRWVDGYRQRLAPFFASYLWPHGHAALAKTPEEASAALAALPANGELPAFYPLTSVEGAIGNTMRLAGRLDDALHWLRIAVGKCGELEHPVETVRARLGLGQALEAKGDAAVGIARARSVLDAWGNAKPKSVTAETARARSKGLGCR